MRRNWGGQPYWLCRPMILVRKKNEYLVLVMKKGKLIYLLLLVAMNAIGLLGIFYLTVIYNLVAFVELVLDGIPGPVAHHDPNYMVWTYGVGVIVIVSLISFLITLGFRNRLDLNRKKIMRIMLIHLLVLLLGSCIIIRLFYIT